MLGAISQSYTERRRQLEAEGLYEVLVLLNVTASDWAQRTLELNYIYNSEHSLRRNYLQVLTTLKLTHHKSLPYHARIIQKRRQVHEVDENMAPEVIRGYLQGATLLVQIFAEAAEKPDHLSHSIISDNPSFFEGTPPLLEDLKEQ